MFRRFRTGTLLCRNVQCNFLTQGSAADLCTQGTDLDPTGRAQAQNRQGGISMKTVSRIGIVVATVAMSIGLLGAPAHAYKDTSWGCPGCIVSNGG